MTGKHHKMIGTAAGVAMTIWGIKTGQPEFMVGLLSAPIGALFPDVDHSGSMAGKKRVAVVKFIKRAFPVAAVCGLGWVGFNLGVPVLAKILIYSILVSLPMLVILRLAKSKPSNRKGIRRIQSLLKREAEFFKSHRGFMHTLIVPAVCYFCSLCIAITIFMLTAQGFVCGYLSHIGADLMTVDGCPIFYPFSKKKVHILSIRTGSKAEQVAVYLIAGGVICLAIII